MYSAPTRSLQHLVEDSRLFFEEEKGPQKAAVRTSSRIPIHRNRLRDFLDKPVRFIRTLRHEQPDTKNPDKCLGPR